LPDSRLVLLGVFGAAQGVKGEIRVKSFTGAPAAIGGYGPLTDASGARAFVFERLRPLKDDMVVAKLAGIADRDAAQALTGVEIFARRAQLPPPSEDEFYHADLIGLEATTRAGLCLGRVVEVLNYGAGDILAIVPDGGGEALLVPFSKAAAPEIDFTGGRIVVEPPDEI
jgi:16S rRNA processing protein RimM